MDTPTSNIPVDRRILVITDVRPFVRRTRCRVTLLQRDVDGAVQRWPTITLDQPHDIRWRRHLGVALQKYPERLGDIVKRIFSQDHLEHRHRGFQALRALPVNFQTLEALGQQRCQSLPALLVIPQGDARFRDSLR